VLFETVFFGAFFVVACCVRLCCVSLCCVRLRFIKYSNKALRLEKTFPKKTILLVKPEQFTQFFPHYNPSI